MPQRARRLRRAAAHRLRRRRRRPRRQPAAALRNRAAARAARSRTARGRLAARRRRRRRLPRRRRLLPQRRRAAAGSASAGASPRQATARLGRAALTRRSATRRLRQDAPLTPPVIRAPSSFALAAPQRLCSLRHHCRLRSAAQLLAKKTGAKRRKSALYDSEGEDDGEAAAAEEEEAVPVQGEDEARGGNAGECSDLLRCSCAAGGVVSWLACGEPSSLGSPCTRSLLTLPLAGAAAPREKLSGLAGRPQEPPREQAVRRGTSRGLLAAAVCTRRRNRSRLWPEKDLGSLLPAAATGATRRRRLMMGTFLTASPSPTTAAQPAASPPAC